MDALLLYFVSTLKCTCIYVYVFMYIYICICIYVYMYTSQWIVCSVCIHMTQKSHLFKNLVSFIKSVKVSIYFQKRYQIVAVVLYFSSESQYGKQVPIMLIKTWIL